MFRFFRSIRQQLLNENKTVKYLKYATGEFILVVLGILVALQINNWNEGRKLDQQRVELIENLKADFQTNLKRFDDGLALADTVNEGLLNFLRAATGGNDHLSVDELKSLGGNAFVAISATPVFSVSVLVHADSVVKVNASPLFTPELYQLTDQAFREMIAQKEVYSIFESRLIIRSRMRGVISNLKETSEQILATLEAL
jgi:hypothetical protein